MTYIPIEYAKCLEKIVMLPSDIHSRRGAYYRESYAILRGKVSKLSDDYISQCAATNKKNWFLSKAPTDIRKSQINFIVRIADVVQKSKNDASIQTSKQLSDAVTNAQLLAEMSSRDVLLGAIFYRYLRLKNEKAYVSCDLFVVLMSLLNLNAPGAKPLDDFTLLACLQAFYEYLYTPVKEGAKPTWEQFEYITKDTDFKINLEAMMGVETDPSSLRSKSATINHQMKIVAILQGMVIQLSEDEALIMRSYEDFKKDIKKSDYSYTAVSKILNDHPKKYSARFKSIVLDAWPNDDDERAIANLKGEMDAYFKPNLTIIFQYPLLAMSYLIREKLPKTDDYNFMRLELDNILKETKNNVIGPEDLTTMMLALRNYMSWPEGNPLDVRALWPEDRLFQNAIDGYIQEDEANVAAFQLA